MNTERILVAYFTMIRKETLRIFRIWSQTLLPPVVTTGLYFAIFGAFIGSQVAPIEGYSYMQFIMPGLVMMTLITSAYMHVVTGFYIAKFMKSLEEILVSPMPWWAVVGGYVSGGIIRATVVSVMVIIVSLFFTHLAVANIFVLVAAAFLTSLIFSLGGLINGMFAKSFDAMTIIPTFVLTPLTYLGGVFYSIELLPPLFQTLSLFNPILYMVNAFRYGFLGVSDVSLTTSFAVMIGFAVVLIAVVAYLFKKGIGFRQ